MVPGFAKSLLDVADNMSRALDAAQKMPADQLEANTALKSMLEGVMMTQSQMLAAFAKHGIVKLSPAGQKVNPNHHEAILEVPDADKEAGTVAAVFKDGYLLKDRLLRAAVVSVYRKP